MKNPMTPAEYDAAKRELERRCPYLSATSGRRDPVRNAAVGGSVDSKHALLPCMAQDYVAADQTLLSEARDVALELGMWVLLHDVGSGDHLHTQGLPTGVVPEWWMAKYGG